MTFKLTIIGNGNKFNKVPAALTNHLLIINHKKRGKNNHEFILLKTPSSDVLDYLSVLIAMDFIESFTVEKFDEWEMSK